MLVKSAVATVLREQLRCDIFLAPSLLEALEIYAERTHEVVDAEFAISGLPRSVLSWRLPDIHDTGDEFVLWAAAEIGKIVKADAATLLAEAIAAFGAENLYEALCVIEDRCLIVQNFWDRYGDDA